MLFILAGTAFLAITAFAVFVFIVVSIHRTQRVPLAETRGKHSGSFARCLLVGIEGKEDGE